MSGLLSSLKADLTSRRMLPLLAIAGLALLGALAFVALGSKSSAPTTSTTAPAPTEHVAALPGPTVSAAPANPNAAASETTVGATYQHRGKMRNPFAPVPGTSSPKSASSSNGGGGSGASGTSSSSGGGGAPSTGGSPPSSGGSGAGSGSSGSPRPSGEGSSGTPASIALYHVDVSLQRLSEEGKPVGKPQSFHDVIELQPLPSKRKPLVAPEGVTGNGTGLAFVLIGEEIIHGKATCIPSPANCQVIDLKLGVPEELQDLEEDGTVVSYKLTVTKIEKVSGSASAASAHPSAAGSALLVRRHLSIPSSAAFDGKLGTIVGNSGPASAHAAKRSRHTQK